MIRGLFRLPAAALLLPVLSGMAGGQELTFDNLEFEYLHNADLIKSDLIEKVVMIHFWGTT